REIFEGNIFEGNTFIPILQNIETKYNLGKPIIIADSGLLSDKNRASLDQSGYKYILGARLKNTKEKIKNQILSFGLKDGENKIIKLENKTRLVVTMSDKRAYRDEKNRRKGFARLQTKIKSGKLTKANINNRGYNKYLKLEGNVNISLDENKFIADAGWNGIKGYVTNTKLSVNKIIENYGNLWYIERAFRINKTDLRIRPIYHRLRNRIEGHICICFTSYTILLEMERMLKRAKSDITIKRAQELTKNMYQLTYTLPKSRMIKTKILKMDDEQQKLYQIVVQWILKR
ncbi:MAG: transposase, partial [Bacteroidales bacterium]|nr:transposase [Bacteroidales bacterium]